MILSYTKPSKTRFPRLGQLDSSSASTPTEAFIRSTWVLLEMAMSSQKKPPLMIALCRFSVSNTPRLQTNWEPTKALGSRTSPSAENPSSSKTLPFISARSTASATAPGLLNFPPRQSKVPPTRSGHFEKSTLKKQHKKALRLSRVRPFVLYSLRHTFLTRLGESGCDAWTLARIAGHSSVAMSARYVHPSEDAVLLALDRLSGHNFGHSGNTSQKTHAVEPRLSASND
jgi:hypothetical protein